MEQSARAEQVLAKNSATLAQRDFKIAALTLELAYYRRIKLGQKSESFSGEQRELFEETVNTDLAAIEAELEGKLILDGSYRLIVDVGVVA